MTFLKAMFIILALFLSTWDRGMASSSLPSCKQAWSKLIPQNLHKFDYSKYSADSLEYKQKGHKEYIEFLQRSKCQKEWTVLIFMAADAPDIEPYAKWDIYEMESGYKHNRNYAGSTLKTDVLVELDTFSNKETIKRMHIFQTPEPFRPQLGKDHFSQMPENELASPVVEEFPETGEGAIVDQGMRLRHFIEWGIKNYPAKHYMVVIWGHGQGWGAQVEKRVEILDFTPSVLREKLNTGNLDKNTTDSNRSHDLEDWGGVALDYTQRTYLDIPSLRVLLDEVKQNSLGGRPIDILANDACLMQMLEVTTELSQGARYIIGSSQVQSFLGLPYRSILHEINSGRMGKVKKQEGPVEYDEAPQMARMILDLYRQSYDPKRGQQGRHDPEASKSMTLSVVSTDQLRQSLLPTLREFSRRLLDYLVEDRSRAIDLLYVVRSTPGFLGSARDLGLFLSALEHKLYEDEKSFGPNATSFLLKEAIIGVLKATDMVVLKKVYGADYAKLFYESNMLINYFKGLTVFLPEESVEYEERRDTFGISLFYSLNPRPSTSHGLWQEWMDLIYLN